MDRSISLVNNGAVENRRFPYMNKTFPKIEKSEIGNIILHQFEDLYMFAYMYRQVFEE